MKLNRWILIAGVAALAACSSPSLPKIPQPPKNDSTDTKPGTGFVLPVTLPVAPISITG